MVIYMQQLKILFYAINGTGLGHLSRLNNIAEDAALLCEKLGITPKFEFLTTSDAPALVNKFLTTKLPSKTTVRELNLPIRSATGLIKAQIISLVSSSNADCLVLDTNPKGSYGEFPFLRDLAKTSVFIDREKKTEVVDKSFKNYVKLFDSVIVPERQGAMTSDCFHPNMCFSGKVHGFKPETALDRSSVKSIFGATNKKLIYLTSGGGGDPLSEKKLNEWINVISARFKDARIVVGYGALYKGNICYSLPNVIPYTGFGINKFFAGFDFAISAAGYNTFEELKAAKCPSMFYSLEKGMDDQLARIEQSANKQLCYLASDNLAKSLVEFQLNIPKIKSNLLEDDLEVGSVIAAGKLLETALSKRSIKIGAEEIQKEVSVLISQRKELATKLQTQLIA